jgi:Cu/Ag efflux pump CusA
LISHRLSTGSDRRSPSGFIALAGVAAETGVVMLIYLDGALAELKAERGAQRRPFTRGDLHRAVMEGARSNGSGRR